MKKLHIIHLGLGKVGKTLAHQVMRQSNALRDKYLIDLVYCGLFNSRGGYFARDGFSNKKLSDIINSTDKNWPSEGDILDLLSGIRQPFVLIDTSASEKTFPIIMAALAKGGYAVLSNKKPLAGRREQYDLLQQLGQGRLFYETTVGAGLPVIKTLKDLIATGDEIMEIQGCFSGTLGFLFSRMENGVLFSESVREAMKKGYTEPDPRDDLSGLDVGRKALILARMMGLKLELADIKIQKLYPDEFEKLTTDEFLHQIKKLDKGNKDSFDKANKKNNTLRYTAVISKTGCQAALHEVSKSSDLGSLQGSDNIIIFKTKRYFNRPLVIKGPGAGIEVTAAGVFADILTVAGMI